MSLTPLPRFLLPSRARIRIVLLAVLGAIAFGTVVFHLLEGWSILDSLYVTVQTVTTVGFGDITPRTGLGRVFATVFMMIGVGVVLYALTSTVQSIVHSEMLARYGHSRKMSKLQDHFIICGAGRVGSHLMRSLRAVDGVFLVIESDQRKCEALMDLNIPVLVRDATLEESLVEAGVEHARGLASCLPDDADNVYVVLTARDLNPNIHIVVRTRYLRELEELHQLGVDDVVPEEFETSIEIFALVLRTYNMPQDLIVRKAEQVRREGYELLRRSELPELAHHLRGPEPRA